MSLALVPSHRMYITKSKASSKLCMCGARGIGGKYMYFPLKFALNLKLF